MPLLVGHADLNGAPQRQPSHPYVRSDMATSLAKDQREEITGSIQDSRQTLKARGGCNETRDLENTRQVVQTADLSARSCQRVQGSSTRSLHSLANRHLVPHAPGPRDVPANESQLASDVDQRPVSSGLNVRADWGSHGREGDSGLAQTVGR